MIAPEVECLRCRHRFPNSQVPGQSVTRCRFCGYHLARYAAALDAGWWTIPKKEESHDD